MTSPGEYYQPLIPEDLGRYIKREIAPPVDAQRLELGLLKGDERSVLRTPTTGDLSLILRYKGREGFVASMGDEGDALSILQFQGATRQEGYRVVSGVHVVRLFADQIHEIATHPESPYREMYMPPAYMIEGVEVAVSAMVKPRYEALAAELGMQYSEREQLFLKKLK
jgi:hypothetical protein